MRTLTIALLFSALVFSCSNPDVDDLSGVTVQMDFRRSAGFYTAPFPSDDLQNEDGSIRIEGFPNPDKIKFVASTLEVIGSDVKGFGLASGIFLQLSGTPDLSRLPDPFTRPQLAHVYLVNVMPNAPGYMQRHPIDVTFTVDAGPFGASNMLSLIPVQGMPLTPNTTYAAVVERTLLDTHGKWLGVSRTMQDLTAGKKPAGMSTFAFAKYKMAIDALGLKGLTLPPISGIAVFTTGDPAAQMGVFRTAILALPRPPLDAPFALTNTFSNFCVYKSTLNMPVYQNGTPPFDDGGGRWTVDATGAPILHGTEKANVIVTVPRRPVPTAGFPTVIVVRTGGDPLVNRGVHPVAHEPSVTDGTGPALEYAKEGFAGITVDGPHGGLRNVTKGDEQVLMFNILNPPAMRDNVRQTALETILIANMVEGLSIDTAGCAGASAVTHFDSGKLVLMGHSMGATVAQPVLAFEPKFKAMIISGAGASWLENLVHKQKPLDVKRIAELLLAYPKYARELSEHDPVVSLAQWAGDPSDAPAYNRLIQGRHILMFQGIVDHYIMPPIANATSLSLGLDLAGGSVDATVAELNPFRTLESLFPLYGGRKVEYPVSYNGRRVEGPTSIIKPAGTSVVVQYVEDGIEDGHEVAFQTEAPKRQYRCFLRTFAAGKPVVDDPAKSTCAGGDGY